MKFDSILITTTTTTDNDMEKLKPSYIASWLVKWPRSFGKQVVVCQKANQIFHLIPGFYL